MLGLVLAQPCVTEVIVVDDASLSPLDRVWVVAFAGAMVATYMVGIELTRYFAAVWPVAFLALGGLVDFPARVLLPVHTDGG